MDASAILDNAFDNAINACTHNTDKHEKYIHLQIFRNENMFVILMRNPANNMPAKGETGLISTKPKNENYGLGLKNIKDSVENYYGTMSVEFSEGEFVLTSTLNIPLKCKIKIFYGEIKIFCSFIQSFLNIVIFN